MELFIIVLVLITLCFLLMGIRVWIKGEFAQTEVGHNDKMKEMGIMCAKDEEMRMLNNDKTKACTSSCSSCGTSCL